MQKDGNVSDCYFYVGGALIKKADSGGSNVLFNLKRHTISIK